MLLTKVRQQWENSMGCDHLLMQCHVYSLSNTVCSCEDPLSANQCTTTEVLVQRVDKRHLPAPLGRLTILSSHYTSLSVPATSCPLNSAHILAVHWRTGRRGAAYWRSWGHNACYSSINCLSISWIHSTH